MGLSGAGWGKGQIDQSHADSFSHQSAPTDNTVWLGCSFVMAVSSLYVSPRAETISPLGRMSSCHSVAKQCCPLTIPKPLPKPSPLTLRPRIVFPPRGCCTNYTEKQAQWLVRHSILHYLLARHSLDCFRETKWRDTECCIDFCNIDFPLVCYWRLFFYWECEKQEPSIKCFCSGILVSQCRCSFTQV